jgi:hypothetical protein
MAVLASIFVWFKLSWPVSDRLAAINDILAGAAFVLALGAGVILLIDHASSTGRPVIQVQVTLGGGKFNVLRVVSTRDSNENLSSLGVQGQEELRIRLLNSSRYDASDLSVLVFLRGASILPESDSCGTGWVVVDRLDTEGVTAVEREVVFSLIGGTSRTLPTLNLPSLRQLREFGPSAVDIYIASKGYSRHLSFPLQFNQVREGADLASFNEPSVQAWI